MNNASLITNVAVKLFERLLVCGVSLLCVIAAAYAGELPLLNPGFEEGVGQTAWHLGEDSCFSSPGNPALIDDNEAHTGQYSLKLKLDSDKAWQIIDMPLEEGCELTLSAWVKMPAPGSPQTKVLTFNLYGLGTMDDCALWSANTFPDYSGPYPEWTKLSFTHVAPVYADRIAVQFDTQNGPIGNPSIELWIDDVTLSTPCFWDVLPEIEAIEAKLDDETRFTDDDELSTLEGNVITEVNVNESKIDAIEAKLDDESRFTDNSELQAQTSELRVEIDINEEKIDTLEAKADSLEVTLEDYFSELKWFDIKSLLTQKICPDWMYKPEYWDEEQTIYLGGFLELVFEVIQATIDEGRVMECPEDKYLDEAQCLLDAAQELASQRPYDCADLCATLIKAYHKAIKENGKALKCEFEDEDEDESGDLIP